MILFVARIRRAYLRRLSVREPCCKKSVNIDAQVLTNKYVKPAMHVMRLRTRQCLIGNHFDFSQ